MFSRIVSVLAVGIAAAVIAACGDSGSNGTATKPAESLKVGLLMPGSATDGGWNQLAANSMAKIAGDQKVELVQRQEVPKDKAADAIRQFESKGFAVVILHGYEYLDVAKELSDPAKPTATKMKLAVSGGDMDDSHFQSLFYDLGPASYQLGVLAAKVSKSGKLGFIGGQPFPTVKAMYRGFEAGAKSVNPEVTIAELYTDDWANPAKAKSRAESLIALGVDVIMQNVDAASSGVFEAVKEANAKERPSMVYTFGANSDQNGNAICPDFTLGSAVIKMDAAFANVTQAVKDGTFKGGLVHEDLSNGMAVAVLNPRLIGKVINTETQKLVEEAGMKLVAGQLKIPAAQ